MSILLSDLYVGSKILIRNKQEESKIIIKLVDAEMHNTSRMRVIKIKTRDFRRYELHIYSSGFQYLFKAFENI